MHLSNHEAEVMEVMWSAGRSLTRSEIIDLSEGCSWKPSTIHLLLNKLILKHFIEADGFVRTGKNYGRTYSPLITRDEYLLTQFRQSCVKTKPTHTLTTGIFSTLILENDIDDDTIRELEQMIAERNKETNK